MKRLLFILIFAASIHAVHAQESKLRALNAELRTEAEKAQALRVAAEKTADAAAKSSAKLAEWGVAWQERADKAESKLSAARRGKYGLAAIVGILMFIFGAIAGRKGAVSPAAPPVAARAKRSRK